MDTQQATFNWDQARLTTALSTGIVVRSPMRAMHVIPAIYPTDSKPVTDTQRRYHKLVSQMATRLAIRNKLLRLVLSGIAGVLVTFALLVLTVISISLLPVLQYCAEIFGIGIGSAAIFSSVFAYEYLSNYLPSEDDYNFVIKHKGRTIR